MMTKSSRPHFRRREFLTIATAGLGAFAVKPFGSLAAAADAVGLSFEETRPLLDGAHPYLCLWEVRHFEAITAQIEVRGAQPGSVRWLAA